MGRDDELDFDPDALRERYRLEREKRLRADGVDQYREARDDLARYVEVDPYAPTTVERDPIDEDVEVAIVGGGFSGLLAAARLSERGVTDFRLVEAGADFGGTWYWNRYPGAQCDTDAYCYLPLLEELGYMPKEKYAYAGEIFEHSQRIGRHYGLYERTHFSTRVTSMEWDDSIDRWHLRTDRGDDMRARFVVTALGPMTRPKLPGIPGLETFAGHSFHTGRWDYAYTGGDSYGNLTGLADKRVGIIGTGATAVQCIPHLGAAAEHLYVFQRTPSSIDVRDNRPTDPEWAQSLQAGWQKRRMENFNNLVSGVLEPEDLVSDGWTDIIGKLLIIARRGDGDFTSADGIANTMELADFEKMEQIRARVDALVADPVTAELLKPYYRQFCKRPCFHDEYLDTYNRANVTLVDTDGKGVDRITERGVVVGDTEYELDCLIYATGFEVGTDYTRRAGYEVYGRDGVTLTEKWSEGAATLHGMHSRGFPNCFIFSPTQAGFTANFPHLLDEQSRHLAYILGHATEQGVEVIEASQQAEDDWVQRIIDMAQFNMRFLENCTPGYYNNEGKPAERSIRNSSYGAGSIAFFKVLADWRDEGSLAGLELS
jgi:cyclohexanone monooxygenase